MLSAKKEVDAIVQQLQESADRERAKNQFIYDQLNKAVTEKQKNYDEVSLHNNRIVGPRETHEKRSRVYLVCLLMSSQFLIGCR